MSDLRIMYVCTLCAEENPEGCGHYDLTDLVVMPNGDWLCEQCWDDAPPREKPTYGKDDDDPVGFRDMPHPPKYVKSEPTPCASLVSPPKAGARERLDDNGLVAAEAAWRASIHPTCKGMLTEAITAYLRIAAPNHEARGDGVRALLRIAEAFNEEHGDPADTLHHGRAMIEAMRAALPPLGDGRAEIVEGVTFAKLRSAIEQSRNRNVAGGGWCLTDKQADTALEWAAFLEGIGAPCPKIAGFDEGLQLVWPGHAGRHYLSLDDGDDGAFVLNVDAKGRHAPLSLEQGEKP